MVDKNLPSFSDESKMRATWTAGAGYYDTLIELKRAIISFFMRKEVDAALWGIKSELMLVEPFLRKKTEVIKMIEALLMQAEQLIYSDNQNERTRKLNFSLALNKLYEAERQLNMLEGVNKMLQPVGDGITEKMMRYGT